MRVCWLLLILVFSVGARAQTMLSRPAADVLGLSTAGSERLRVTSSGRVGIGTTNPAQMLSVAGSIESTTGGFVFPDGTVQTTAAYGGGINNTVFTGLPDFVVCGYSAVPTDVFPMVQTYRYADGRTNYVAAGYSGTYYLTLNGDGSYNTSNGLASTGSYPCVNRTAAQLYGNGQGFNFAKGPAAQWLQNGSSAYYNAGNVGIGSSAPDTRFRTEIPSTDGVGGSGPAGSYPIAKFINTGAGPAYRGLEIGAPPGSISAPVYIKVTGTSSRFSIVDQSDTENFTILDTGNVGVGTTNPAVRLQVQSSSTTTDYSSVVAADVPIALTNLSATPNNMSILSFTDNSNYGVAHVGAVVTDHTNHYGSLFFSTKGDAGAIAKRMVISPLGNVGVGTSAPAGKLDVAGKVVHDGVEELNWAGLIMCNSAYSYTVNHDNPSIVEVTAGFSHYGYTSNYGATRKSIISNGSGTLEATDIVNVSSANCGAWSYTRTSATSFTINKSAGSYNANGRFFITVRGSAVLSK